MMTGELISVLLKMSKLIPSLSSTSIKITSGSGFDSSHWTASLTDPTAPETSVEGKCCARRFFMCSRARASSSIISALIRLFVWVQSY